MLCKHKCTYLLIAVLSVVCSVPMSFQNQADVSAMSADGQTASCSADSGADVCVSRSASRTFAVTWSSAVVTSYTVTDTVPVISSQPRVTLSELQPTLSAPVIADMPHDLKTCFENPSAAAMLTSDGSYRTTYGPTQISAQVLSLPRSITNCRNLSRPLTLCYAGRQVIVPPSCIVLGAEGAKLLLPPQTIVPSKPPPDPVDLSSNSTHTISSTAELTPSSLSKGGSASETDRTDSLLLPSSDCKGDPVDEPHTIGTVPGADSLRSTSEAQYSAESANQEASLDEGQKCATDQFKEVDISKLSDRSLVHIFTFLHVTDLLQVRLVCSRWNTAAHDPSLVKCSLNTRVYTLPYMVIGSKSEGGCDPIGHK